MLGRWKMSGVSVLSDETVADAFKKDKHPQPGFDLVLPEGHYGISYPDIQCWPFMNPEKSLIVFEAIGKAWDGQEHKDSHWRVILKGNRLDKLFKFLVAGCVSLIRETGKIDDAKQL